MDLSKFLNLLQEQSFWMTRADYLGDDFEGSMTVPMHEAEQAFFKSQNLQHEILGWRKKHVESYFVSCWHANDQESVAMWKLYSKSSEAVCILSSFDKISSILPDSMFGGMIKYVDYEVEHFDPSNGFNYIMHKRRSFEHERECRFVAWDLLANTLGGDKIKAARRGIGLAWKVNPSSYIDSVFVSPAAPSWFVEVIRRVVKDYKLEVPVHQSSLARDPLF